MNNQLTLNFKTKTALALGKLLAALAMLVAVMNANSACIFFLHQPSVPEDLSKLRRF